MPMIEICREVAAIAARHVLCVRNRQSTIETARTAFTTALYPSTTIIMSNLESESHLLFVQLQRSNHFI